ncbi:hypothetical protein G3A_05170 [Bacillus sp. 17376]|uniref:Uncharacterized protein n=1 Tax=Mesobacillus boroniphilus JCM 21738 TaxID=1294265 RepID=W4RU25_9BACI|nr:hypothetical protein [Mesobacillus boroniphilus]ESU33594.1 hypothetical protein G3A_05170 [Bacillus sp. 17376]GAE47816.1 hypothetical protein JCM21738_4836 [Mesobacillus boroniphilus JCM 21738]
MKRNTGCNSYGCPPQPNCDQAETFRVDCSNNSYPPDGKHLKYPVVDVPVPLAEVEIQAEVEADIQLPTAAREIKHMRRNVSLKQCKAIRSKMDPHMVKLYITGVVHKNIQYVESCSGNVKDYSVDVPFNCNQAVYVKNYPDHEHFSQKNTVYERRYTDKHGMGADNCTSGAYTYEYYNQPIDCKLLFSFVNDLDLYKDHDAWGRFKRITEKMEVGLFIKLLQEQQVALPSKYEKDDASCSYKEEYKGPKSMQSRIYDMMRD